MPTTTAKPIKVYLGVEVDFGSDGVMLPRTIIWEDGSRFDSSVAGTQLNYWDNRD